MHSKHNRLAGLDTLRAFAIVWVMIYHLQLLLPHALQVPGTMGWLGVDLFFVLSGYLIGSQLLRGVAHGGGLHVLDFYRRRAYRILPAYLVVVALYLFVPQWREADRLPAAWKLLTFTANLWMNYPAERAFSHVWSLCIEEHFYLLLPLVVLLLARVRRQAAVIGLFIVLFAVGVAVRWWMLHHAVLTQPEDDQWVPMMKFIYYPTYARLDGLLCGLALAAMKLFKPAWWRCMEPHGNVLLVAGLLVCTAGMAMFHFEYPSPDAPIGLVFGFPLVSLGFALLVAAAVCPRGLITRRLPGANVVAALAFSLYLTHKSVAHVDALVLPWLHDHQDWLAVCVYAASCIAVAAALYLCVERPFLRLRDHRSSAARADVEARIDPAL